MKDVDSHLSSFLRKGTYLLGSRLRSGIAQVVTEAPGRLVKTQAAGCHSRDPGSVDAGWAPRTCICHRCQARWMLLAQRPHLENHRLLCRWRLTWTLNLGLGLYMAPTAFNSCFKNQLENKASLESQLSPKDGR